MDSATERSYRQVKIIVLLLFIGGIIAALLGLATVAVGKLGVMAGFLLLFGCVVAIAMAQLLELLTEIADHLAAIRDQLSRGVFGLLG
jgi:hypothetical protein